MKTIEEKYKSLSETEHILQRSGMWVGSTKSEISSHFIYDTNTLTMRQKELEYVPAMLKLVDEIISNSCDEFRRKDNLGLTKLIVTISKDNTISVQDNGGIAIVKHKDAGIMLPKFIFGQLRTSSNYDDTEDRNVVGTNGLGAVLVGIFSTEFTVKTSDGKKQWVGTWKSNMSEFGNEEITKSNKNDHGTTTIFKLDMSRFDVKTFTDDFKSIILTRCIEAAAANIGLDVTCIVDGKTYNFCFSSIKEYIELFREYVSLKDVIEYKDENKTVYIYPDGNINVGFVNGASCDKGTHIKELHSIVNNVVVEFLNKKDKIELTPRNIDGNYSMFCNVTVSNPAYSSQTKEELTTPINKFYKDESIKFELNNATLDKILKSDIIENVRDWYKKKCEAEDQKTLRKLNKEASKGLKRSDKYVPANSKKRTGKQLWIYEGDSAGRGLRIGRDPETQAGYLMRGVPPNSLDMSPLQIMKNDVFNDLITILGLKFGEDFNINDLKFDKIVISTDADVDGDKIAALLLLLFSHWPELFKQGIVCRSITPIIIAKKGKDVKKYYSIEEFDKESKKLKGYMIKYVKGLSGLDAAETKETMRNPIFMHFKEDDLTNSMFKKWFGKNSDERKNMMCENV